MGRQAEVAESGAATRAPSHGERAPAARRGSRAPVGRGDPGGGSPSTRAQRIGDVPEARAPCPALTVFYDGACPLCRREIRYYQRRKGAERIRWTDVSRSQADIVAPGLRRDDALARFHVMECDGRLLTGGAAFARLWRALPAFRLPGRLFSFPPLARLLDYAYVLFLRWRPRLQSLAGRFLPAAAAGRPPWLIRDLRSDHAGETGAVAIYGGILKFSRDPDVRHFAEEHLATEREHLRLIESVVPENDRSALLAVWRGAGFLTGALPALLGPVAVYATVDAVETFVDHHYADQIRNLSPDGPNADLRRLLERCRADEVQHRDEARQSMHNPGGWGPRLWRFLVGSGSAAAVVLAKRV